MKRLIIRAVAALLFVCSGLASAQIVNPAFVAPGAGATARTYLDKGRDLISVKDYGAKGDGVTDDTAAIQAALNICGATGKRVLLPAGRYKYTQLNVDACTNIIGEGFFRTVLSPTSVAGNKIVFGNSVVSDGGYYANFGIAGNATTLIGIKLGTSATIIALNLTFEKIRISGFTATNAAGVYLQSAQDIRFVDAVVAGNYRNVYRPDTDPATTGFLTSTVFEGQAGQLDLATGDGSIVADGELNLTLKDIALRSNAKSAIKVNTSTHNNNGNKLVLDRIYLENNNTSNTGGIGEIDIAGPATATWSFRLLMQDVDFWLQANPMQQLKLDRVGAYVKNTGGGASLLLSKITATANTAMWLEGNSYGSAAGANYEASGFPSFLGKVFIVDHDYTQSYWYTKGVMKFIDPPIIMGTVAANNAISGQVGEVISATQGTQQAARTTNVWYQVTSITLTPGDWDVYGQVFFIAAGAMVQRANGAISLYPGSTITDIADGDTSMSTSGPTADANTSISVTVRASSAASQIYYLKASMGFSAGTPTAIGKIWARRRR